jgi:hypothetical protein
MYKKGSAIAVGLLVLATLVISVISLMYFVIEKNSVNEDVGIADDVDEVYARQLLLNFYVQDVFDKASKNFQVEEGVEGFLGKFSVALNEYKDSEENYPIKEMEVLEDVSGDEILLNEDRLVLELDLRVESRLESMDINYDYNKEFVKVFK